MDPTSIHVSKDAHEEFVKAIETKHGYKRGLVRLEADRALRERAKELREQAAEAA